MADIKTVTPDFAVAPQIEPADVAEIAARGYALIVNNRPDGEAPGQPTSAEVEAAARAAGLAYVHIPVVGRPAPAQIGAMRQAMAGANGPVFAFCRSGTRSITTWALGEAGVAARSREDILGLALGAGYDLSGVL